MLKMDMKVKKEGEVIQQIAKLELNKEENQLNLVILGDVINEIDYSKPQAVKKAIADLFQELTNEFEGAITGSNLYNITIQVYDDEGNTKNELVIEDDFTKLEFLQKQLLS